MKLASSRLPTLFGILVLTLGIAGGVWLIKSAQNPEIKAREYSRPQLASITDDSQVGYRITDIYSQAGVGYFTITWFTTSPTAGLVTISTNPNQLGNEQTLVYSSYSGQQDINNLSLSQIHSISYTTQTLASPHYLAFVAPGSDKIVELYGQCGGGSYENPGLICSENSKPDTLAVPTNERCSGGIVCDPITIMVPPAVNSNSTDTLQGVLVDKNNQPITQGIVYATTYISATETEADILAGNNRLMKGFLSSTISTDGSWQMFLNHARAGTAADQSPTLISNETRFTLQVITSSGAELIIPACTLAHLKAGVTLKLGESECFTVQSSQSPPILPPPATVLPDSAVPTSPVDPGTGGSNSAPPINTDSGFQPPPGNFAANPNILTIQNPEPNESLIVASPEFFGTAPVGVTLDIEVNSATQQTGQVVVDNTNRWSWTPPADLEPGDHSVTVSYRDKDGILQTLTRSFTVLAAEAGDNPTGYTASGSATLTPTLSITPTPTPSVAPTATPVPRSYQPDTDAGIPSSGAVESSLALLGLASLFIAGGLWEYYRQHRHQLPN